MPAYTQALVNGIMLGVIYVVVALGLTLVFGMMHIVNFAHGEIYTLGAFVLWTLMVAAGTERLHWTSGWAYLVAVPVTIFVLFILGTLLELLFFSRFPGRAGLFKSLIICLGLAAIFPNTISLVYTPFSKNIPSIANGSIKLGSIYFPTERLVVIALSAVLVVALFLFLKRVKTGLAMVAVEQDGEAAELQGISIRRVRLYCMGIGAALAGAAAAFVAPVLGASPWMGGDMIMNSFNIIIIGGMGSLPGAVLGGLILGLLQSFGTLWMSPPMVNLMVFFLIIVILLVKPTGLLGHA